MSLEVEDKEFSFIMFAMLAAYFAFSAVVLYSIDHKEARADYCKELNKRLTGHNIIKYEWVCGGQGR